MARLCLDAHREQDWGTLRTLLHPKARIGTFEGGGRPEEPDVAIRRLQEAHSDLIYHAEVASLMDLDDKAVLLKGSVRHRNLHGGWSVEERTWLYVVRDGLLYRSAMYESEHQALAAYANMGATLGIADYLGGASTS